MSNSAYKTAYCGLFLFALTACGGAPDLVSGQNCPAAAILAESETYPALQQGQAIWQADLQSVQLTCQHYTEENRIESRLMFYANVTQAAGWASRSDMDKRITLPVFVVIVAPDDVILARDDHSFSVRLQAHTNSRQLARFTEELEGIDIMPEAGRVAADYMILIGFRVDAEQRHYNRQTRLRRLGLD